MATNHTPVDINNENFLTKFIYKFSCYFLMVAGF